LLDNNVHMFCTRVVGACWCCWLGSHRSIRCCRRRSRNLLSLRK
jgi:hypothetical protein